MATYSLPFRKKHPVKDYLDRLDAASSSEQLAELRCECWRTVTRTLAEIPQLRSTTLVCAVLSELIDKGDKQTLVTLLLAIDAVSVQLADEEGVR